MEESKNRGGCLIAAVIWLVILGGLGGVTRYLIIPYFSEKEDQQVTQDTSAPGAYDHTLRIMADSFTGYAPFRSDPFRKEMRDEKIRWIVEDDGADYNARIRALQDGKAQFAVFTIDSYLKAGATLGEFPGTIVLVIDETRGADAIVSYKAGLADLEGLDHPDARIVLTPDSPSEFLARTVIAHFSLPKLPEDWIVAANGAEDVLREFSAADPAARRAYVLWEPHVTQALERPGAQLLIDSSKLKGYIIDVLVVERRFLRDEPDMARLVVEAYLRAAYAYSSGAGGMKRLALDDAKTLASSLSDEQAEKLAQGIDWKNTLENYGYFGLLSAAEMGDRRHIEDVITNITNVLEKTGAIAADPLNGQPNLIYYDAIFKQLKADGFHPGKSVNVISGLGGSGDLQPSRVESKLEPLTDSQWESLRPVGKLRVEPISFGRGSARLNISSQRHLEDLSQTLEAWPRYYLRVIGNVRAEGDPEANKKLSQDRANAALERLKELGVDPARMKAIAAPPKQQNGRAQTVEFVVGELPY